MSYDMETGRKQLTVQRLIELLGELPSAALVEFNRVGNLLVTRADDTPVAFVDFNSEAVEPIPE